MKQLTILLITLAIIAPTLHAQDTADFLTEYQAIVHERIAYCDYLAPESGATLEAASDLRRD